MINKLKIKSAIKIEKLESSVSPKDLKLFSNCIYNKHLESLTREVGYYTKLEWVLRHTQSAKKMMLSSLYFNQALFLYENKMKNLVFYAMYYSLFNAFLSNLYLVPFLTINKLRLISHQQVIIEIENYFVRKKIYSDNILELFSELKMWREAYSYHLPLSGINHDFNNLIQKLDENLPKIYQTSELLSYITYYSWEKCVSTVVDDYSENQGKCDDLFFSFVNIDSDNGKVFHFDENDYYGQSFLMKHSDKPSPISWFISERLCEDLEDNWEGPENDNDFDINKVARHIMNIIS